MRALEDMKILIVDDSRMFRNLIQTLLNDSGYKNVEWVDCAEGAMKYFGMNSDGESDPKGTDLVLMDVIMKEMDGIEACRRIKSDERLNDIPVVMVTSISEKKSLQKAFEAGAVDYITKPFDQVEVRVRVGSVLRLKREIDERKDRERELAIANKELKRLSSLDGLTGIANRRYFDEHIEAEWRRAMRDSKPLSIMIIDIDFFKPYNDHYGHQGGDSCLKQVACAINDYARRGGDFAARYGGEEFVVTLAGTDRDKAASMAEKLREAVESLRIPHEKSKASSVVTVSIGVSTVNPNTEMLPSTLIELADKGLYRAKEKGRNQVQVF